MEKQPHQEYRDSLAKNLKSIPNHDERNDALNFSENLKVYKDAEELHLLDIQEFLKNKQEKITEEKAETKLELESGSEEVELTVENLMKLAKECQVYGYQNKPGIYIALDKGFDNSIISTNSHSSSINSLEIYTQTCEEACNSPLLGKLEIKGILLKTIQLGKMGTEWDARMQVGRDFIAGPFSSEVLAEAVAPYVLQERYGWDPNKIKNINFYSLCF